MSAVLRVETRVALVDESDDTELVVQWDQDERRFELTTYDPDGLTTGMVFTSQEDLLAFADLILKTYAEHDPF